MIPPKAAVPDTSRRSRAHDEVRRAIVDAIADPDVLLALPAGELDFTLRVLRRAQVLGRIALHLRDAGRVGELPQTARDALAGALALADARARVARWEMNRIERALRDGAEVPLVLLKGCAYLALGLPNAAARLFADVDLLVPEADLGAIEARLSSQGWRCAELTAYDENYYRLWTHELPPMTHAERDVEVDLHHNLVMRTARSQPDPRLLLAAARALPDSRYKVLAPADMVLHAIAHLFLTSEIDDSVRELLDIDRMLRHFGTREPGFWEQLWPRAERLNLARPAYYGLRYAKRLMGTPVPEHVIAASGSAAPNALVRRIMDTIVPLAVFPVHPDRGTPGAGVARLLLYIRLHWLRMPPLMLARHLARKFVVRYRGRIPVAENPA